jgi:methionyl-tRNA formyltransferase
VDISPDEDFGALHDRLADVGARALADAARSLAQTGTLPRTPQDRSAATFTKPIRKDDLRISEDRTAREIVDLVRSASPEPAAWTIYDGKRLKVLKASAEPAGSPAVTADGPSLAASDGVVRLLRVIPEGKRAMSGSEFARGIASGS